MMISEKDIDALIDKMETESYEDPFAESEPEYWHYLNSDSFTSLTTEEHQLLFFINSVIYNVCAEHLEEDYEFDIEDYQAFEETNWGVRESCKSWKEATDKFFDGYQEEDLLAFVEDMTSDEEIEGLTTIGREVIMITAKSYIDFFVGE